MGSDGLEEMEGLSQCWVNLMFYSENSGLKYKQILGLSDLNIYKIANIY